MNIWCIEVKIEFTPTIFVNGYQMQESSSSYKASLNEIDYKVVTNEK